MLRICLLIFAFVCAMPSAIAALVWKEDLTIKSVEYSWNGAKETITVVVNESLTTGCSASDTKRQFSYIETGITEYLKLRYSALLAALTANKKVALLYEANVCDTVYGARLEGIRVIN